MPIEIRELHIKAVIEDTRTATGSEGIRGQAGSQNNQPTPDIDEIVTLCVEKILEIMKEKEER